MQKSFVCVLTVLSLLLVHSLAFAADTDLSWQDQSADETGFRVERQVSGGSFALVPSCDVGANVQICHDTNLTAGLPYCYQVFAYNQAGNSPYSNQVCITPSAQTPAPPAVLSCTQVPTTTGLVLAMNFNAGSGPVAVDSSGANNTGTLTNGPTWTNSGKYGKAITFDGVNDTVTVNDSASLDLTTGLTLESWVYPTAGNNWRTVMLKEQSGDLVYSLYASNGSNLPTAILYVGTTKEYLSGPAALPLNTWSHLTVTYNGSVQRLYVNGIQVASRAVTGQIVTSTGALRIGGNAVWGEFFKGKIDEVRIYNRALTAAEITTDKNTAIP